MSLKDDRVSWQIVDDCRSPTATGFRYDAISGDVAWQDCIPPSMYAFTMYNNRGWDGQGKVEIKVDGVVVHPRNFPYWYSEEISFGASSCPSEHAARTMIE